MQENFAYCQTMHFGHYLNQDLWGRLCYAMRKGETPPDDHP